MKKILIIGAYGVGKTSLLTAMLKEEYGKDIKIYTPEEAKSEGLTMNDFSNIPTYKIEAPTIHKKCITDFKYSAERMGKGGRARNRSGFYRKKIKR